MKKLLILGGILIAILGAVWFITHQKFDPAPEPVGESTRVIDPTELRAAYFAGGCFWCTEADFEKVNGVHEVISGYAGGTQANPTYEEVSAHTTGHRESVLVRYDPKTVSYRELVEYHFEHIDAIDGGGQFHDRGESYTSAVFYQNDEEKRATESIMQELSEKKVYEQPIETALIPFTNFYPAEDYHQDYAARHPLKYGYYRNASGRDTLRQEVCQKKESVGLSCITTRLNVKKSRESE